MNKYRVVCTIWKLPKHQRRKLHGKPVSKVVLGHNLIREKSFYITPSQFEEARDQLEELYKRGEAEVRKPDGTLERFVAVEVLEPPPDKVVKLPPSQPVPGYDYDLDEIGEISPIVEPRPKEKPKSKKRKSRKKKVKKEDSVDD